MQPILIFFAYAFEMRFVNFCQFSTDNKKKDTIGRKKYAIIKY